MILVASACGSQETGRPEDSIQKGQEVFDKYICASCHSMNGNEMYGPALNTIYKKEITVLRDGQEVKVTVDRKYLERSIMDPDYEKVLGFEERTMPQPSIPKQDLKALLEYIVAYNEKD